MLNVDFLLQLQQDTGCENLCSCCIPRFLSVLLLFLVLPARLVAMVSDGSSNPGHEEKFVGWSQLNWSHT